MWLLALALVADTVHTFSLALSPAESVAVTVTGTGDPVVLVPGLFGSAFGYRAVIPRSEEHTSELQSQSNLVCRLLPDKKQTPHSRCRRPPHCILTRTR